MTSGGDNDEHSESPFDYLSASIDDIRERALKVERRIVTKTSSTGTGNAAASDQKKKQGDNEEEAAAKVLQK